MAPMSPERQAEFERMERELWADQAPWVADYFTERELRLVANCVEYMDGDPAGLPGHNLMILVAKMATYKGWMHHDRLDELIEMAGKADRPVRVPRGSVISVPGDLWAGMMMVLNSFQSEIETAEVDMAILKRARALDARRRRMLDAADRSTADQIERGGSGGPYES